MLVLSRKIGETIRIGGDVEVTVVSVRGARVRLGLKAPKELPIRRDELLTETASATLAEPNESDLHS